MYQFYPVSIKIGTLVKFPNTQKRESHNDGILFFYTDNFSHSFEITFLSRYQERVSETSINMHYVKLDWSTNLF